MSLDLEATAFARTSDARGFLAERGPTCDSLPS
jgi:hypothetical protein